MTTTPAATEPVGNAGEALASVPQQAGKGYLPLPPLLPPLCHCQAVDNISSRAEDMSICANIFFAL